MVMPAWLVQGSLIHGAASVILALTAGVGAFAKLIQRSGFSAEGNASMPTRLSRSPVVIAMQLAACFTLLLPIPVAWHLVAALIVLIVVIIGQAIRISSPGRTCDCFGSLTPSSGVTFLVFTLFSFLAAICIVLRAVHSPSDTSGFTVWTPVITVSALLAVVVKLRYDAFAANYFVAKYASGESPQSLLPDFELGRAADGTHVTVTNALDERIAMVVIALSATCETCHLLYDDIRTFAEQSGGRVPLILVANNPAVYNNKTSPHLLQLIDKEILIGRYLQMSGTPFAALVNDELELLAPPSKGRDQVRVLLNLTLQLLPTEAA